MKGGSQNEKGGGWIASLYARVAKLVDAGELDSPVLGRAGSNPVMGTPNQQ